MRVSNVSNVSFGHITLQAKRQIEKSTLSKSDKSLIIDTFEKNDSTHLHEVTKDYCKLFGSTAFCQVDDLTVLKAPRPKYMHIKSAIAPDADIYPYSTIGEAWMIADGKEENSHIVSAWLLANRMAERDQKQLEGNIPSSIFDKGVKYDPS